MSQKMSRTHHSLLITHHRGSRAEVEQHVGDDVAAVVELLVGQREGREQPQHGAVCAVDEQSFFQAALYDRRALDAEFYADHGALRANLRDERALLLQSQEPLLEPRADL